MDYDSDSSKKVQSDLTFWKLLIMKDQMESTNEAPSALKEIVCASVRVFNYILSSAFGYIELRVIIIHCF